MRTVSLPLAGYAGMARIAYLLCLCTRHLNSSGGWAPGYIGCSTFHILVWMAQECCHVHQLVCGWKSVQCLALLRWKARNRKSSTEEGWIPPSLLITDCSQPVELLIPVGLFSCFIAGLHPTSHIALIRALEGPGVFMLHCGGLCPVVPAGHPIKRLLICWPLEVGNPRLPN